jgi:hypothetical protein
MKVSLWHTLCCPSCNSPRITRSHAHGYEHFFKLFFVRAYRCLVCKRRFWRMRQGARTLLLVLVWTLAVAALIVALGIVVWKEMQLSMPPSAG